MSRAASASSSAAAVARYALFLRKSPPMRARITHSPQQHRSEVAVFQASFTTPCSSSPPPDGPRYFYLFIFYFLCVPFSNFPTIYKRLVCRVGSMSLDLLRRVLMRDSCLRRLLLPGDEVRKCQLGSTARDKLFRITGDNKAPVRGFGRDDVGQRSSRCKLVEVFIAAEMFFFSCNALKVVVIFMSLQCVGCVNVVKQNNMLDNSKTTVQNSSPPKAAASFTMWYQYIRSLV